ncbi:MAG: hypothetical protein BWY77_01536 [bacterium ADurb.Bin431]|nr:MAG: hypothetical protein BWY77_01536 [bacterium ADurb.Bin431]
MNLLDPSQVDDVAGLCQVGLAQGDAVIDLYPGDAQGDFTLVLGDADQGVIVMRAAVEDPAYGQAAEIVGVVEVRDQHLEGLLRIVARRWNILEDGGEEGTEVASRLREGALDNALAADGIKDREFDLLLGGIEIDKEVKNLVEDLLRPGILAVDLVDHHDDLEIFFEGLLEDKASLRQGPLGGIHQEDGAVDHLEGAFDLAPEIGMARGVENVDLDPLPADRAVFRRNRDAAFALEIHVIHDALLDLLVIAEEPALSKHLIDEGGFAVIDMGDDGDIADQGIGCGPFHAFLLLLGYDRGGFGACRPEF